MIASKFAKQGVATLAYDCTYMAHLMRRIDDTIRHLVEANRTSLSLRNEKGFRAFNFFFNFRFELKLANTIIAIGSRPSRRVSWEIINRFWQFALETLHFCS